MDPVGLMNIIEALIDPMAPFPEQHRLQAQPQAQLQPKLLHSTDLDFTNRLHLLEPNRRMMVSWLLSSGMGLSFVFAMKNQLGLVALIRSVSVQRRIKGIASTEDEALGRIQQSKPGLLICSDQLAEGNGFSLCRRALDALSDLRVVMVMTTDRPDVQLAFDSGAMAVVCEDDFLSPEMDVMQSLLAVANNKTYVSGRARSRMITTAPITTTDQSLTDREREILTLMLQGRSDKQISEEINLSPDTVKWYGKSIRSKYNVKSRLQLIAMLLSTNQQRSH
jgi:DNA-binding NarL/FixJ family response regulator